MNLAVLSVSALVLAVVVSCVSRLNVGVLAVALAWIVGVYVGGLSASAVMGGFPSQLFLTLAGVTLLFAMAQSNGTLPRLTYHAVRDLPRKHGHDSRSCSSCSARRCRRWVRATSRPPRFSRRSPWRRPRARAFRCFSWPSWWATAPTPAVLSPFAPTGIIVNGILARNQMPGLEAQSYLYNLGIHALVAFGGYALFGGLRLFAADRTVSATTDPEGEKPFNRRQWITLASSVRSSSACSRLACTSAWPAFAGAVVLVLRRRGRRWRGDQADAVARHHHGVRRDGAHRARREVSGPRPAGGARRAHLDPRYGARRRRPDHRRRVGLQQHVRRRAAGVPSARARSGRRTAWIERRRRLPCR